MAFSSELVRRILFVYFFKYLISFIGFFDKCHTSVFNALVFYVTGFDAINADISDGDDDDNDDDDDELVYDNDDYYYHYVYCYVHISYS